MLFSKSTGGVYDEDVHKGEIPKDAVEIPTEVLQRFRDGEFSGFDVVDGVVCPASLAAESNDSIKAAIVGATQNRLDAFAQTRNYDSILSACSYATDPTPRFSAEGQYCVKARGETWAKLCWIMAEVGAGKRPAPSGYADVEPELPMLVWPDAK